MKAIKILFIFISVSSFAQSKVGTIDIDFILSKMPELPAIQKQIEDYGKELDVDFNKNLDSYNALVKSYNDGETGFSEEVKKEKQTEILTAENDLGKFQENGTKLISIKRDDLVRPLYQKIGVALEKIAKAEGYTQVVQIDKNIVYLDNNYDLTLLVLKELGIELKEEE
jgi:outer membrane protein